MSNKKDTTYVYTNEKCIVCANIKDCILFQSYESKRRTYICNECSPLCWKCDKNIENWNVCTCNKYDMNNYTM